MAQDSGNAGARSPAGPPREHEDFLDAREIDGGLELGRAEEPGRRVDAQHPSERQPLREQLPDPRGHHEVARLERLLAHGQLDPEPPARDALDESLGPRPQHDAADARRRIGEDLHDGGLAAQHGDSPDDPARHDDRRQALRAVDAPAIDREAPGEPVPVPRHDLRAERPLGQPLAERRQRPEPQVLGLERFLAELPEPEGDGLGPQPRHLGAQVLPVEVPGPERGGAAVDARERHLGRGRDGGDALGKPQSFAGAGLLRGQERHGRHHDEPQDRVLPVADQQIKHAGPSGAIRSGSRPSSGGQARRAPCPSRAPRTRADPRPP